MIIFEKENQNITKYENTRQKNYDHVENNYHCGFDYHDCYIRQKFFIWKKWLSMFIADLQCFLMMIMTKDNDEHFYEWLISIDLQKASHASLLSIYAKHSKDWNSNNNKKLYYNNKNKNNNNTRNCFSMKTSIIMITTIMSIDDDISIG